MKTRIAIVGVGRWGVHFVRHFLQHPQADVTAIIDSYPTNLTACRDKFAIDESKTLLTTDWPSARQATAIDAVVIATPATTHYSLIADALQAGCHVLSEKPLTLNPKECWELIQLAEHNQRQLLIDHTYLFHPAVQRGKQLVESGQLGELRYGYASRTHLGPVRQDVDALWDLAIHDIAIFNNWLGQIPSQVQARGRVWLQPDGSESTGLADLVWATLFYPDGFEAQIHLCWNNPDKQRRLCLVGTQGSLIFDEMSAEAPLTVQHGLLEKQGKKFLPAEQWREVLAVEAGEPLKAVCEAFLAAVRTQQPCLSASGAVAAQLVEVLHCLSLSLQRQGEVIAVRG